MNALLWKDWRQSRPLVVAAGVMYLLPTVIILAAGMIWGKALSESGHARESWVSVMMQSLSVLAMDGAGAATVVIPMYAAMAFARERRERTAEFIRTLPVRQSMVIWSKLVVGGFLGFAPLLASLLIALVAGAIANESYIADWQYPDIWLVIAASGVLLFGWGWLLSALMRSEVMAAAFGLLGGMLTVGAVLATLSRQGLLERAGAGPYIITMAIVGVLTLAAGTVVAAVRKSP